jgi:hypothetical protein
LIAHRDGRRIPGSGGDRGAEAGEDSQLVQGLHHADLEGAAEAAAGEDEANPLGAAQQVDGGGPEVVDGGRAEAVDRGRVEAVVRDRTEALYGAGSEGLDRGRAEALHGGWAEALDAAHAPLAVAKFMTGGAVREVSGGILLLLAAMAPWRRWLHVEDG